MLNKFLNGTAVKIVTILIISSFIVSCFDEAVNTASDVNHDESALALYLLEESGDFINSNEFPAAINADEVNSSLGNFIIIDVRSANDFNDGHIPGSINKANAELFDYVRNLQPGNKKILLVSKTGQAAAYYLTLLRYVGIKNIFSLRFGIAVWNNDFSYLWKNYLRNYINDGTSNQRTDFNNIAEYIKPEKTPLPKISFSNSHLSFKEKVAERVKELINLGFDETSYGNVTTANTMDIDYLVSSNFTSTNEFFVVCFANAALYFQPNISRGCLLQCAGHPKRTYLYNAFPPYNDLRSTGDLQTLPIDKTIVLYSFTGERSAAAVAYLKLLGYNAKSIIFGGQNMFHSRFVTINYYSSELLASFGIQENSFMNYPYEK